MVDAVAGTDKPLTNTTAMVMLALSLLLLTPCLVLFVQALVSDSESLIIWGILALMLFAATPAYIGIAAALCVFRHKPQARGLSMTFLFIFGGLTFAATLGMFYSLAIEQSLPWDIENILWLCINGPLSAWCLWRAASLVPAED